MRCFQTLNNLRRGYCWSSGSAGICILLGQNMFVCCVRVIVLCFDKSWWKRPRGRFLFICSVCVDICRGEDERIAQESCNRAVVHVYRWSRCRLVFIFCACFRRCAGLCASCKDSRSCAVFFVVVFEIHRASGPFTGLHFGSDQFSYPARISNYMWNTAPCSALFCLCVRDTFCKQDKAKKTKGALH